MTEFAEALLRVTTPTAVISTLVFGLMIGAFYGYELESRIPPHYPLQFWFVGLIFIALLASLGALGESAAPLPNSVGRAILWTFLCGSIPIGRWLRIKWATRNHRE